MYNSWLERLVLHPEHVRVFMKMNIKEVTAKIKEVLNSIAPDARTILYGSQARGDARADSDIDILILLPDSYQGKEFVEKKFQISDHLYDLSLDMGVDVSPLITVNHVFYARKTPFTVNIANEGIEL